MFGLAFWALALWMVFAYYYSYVAVPIAAVALIIYVFYRWLKKQRSNLNELVRACDVSSGAFDDIPRHLLTAEQLLDRAEQDFREGAFSPFWDSIEGAIGKLGAVDSNVQAIDQSSRKYAEVAKQTTIHFPAFPIGPGSARKLVAANTTEKRLRDVVRQAQRNFQFATIYEQRKTNQILVAGFESLGDALHGLGERLSASIDGLQIQISEMSSELTEPMKGIDSTLQKGFGDQASSSDQALRMLDNIQRRRIPWSLDRRDY